MDDVLTDILDELDQSREQLLVAIEWLPDEVLVVPGAVGDWSVADVLAILAAWEAELVTALMRLDQGKRPDRLLAALARPADYNAQRVRENRGRELDRIFDDWQGARLRLEEWLETFSERDLINPKRYPALRGKSLRQIIREVTVAKEGMYTPALQGFAARWAADPTQFDRAGNGKTDTGPPLYWERDDDDDDDEEE